MSKVDFKVALSMFGEKQESLSHYIYLRKNQDLLTEEDEYCRAVELCKDICLKIIDDLNKELDELYKDRDLRLCYHVGTTNGHLIEVKGFVGNMLNHLLSKILLRIRNHGIFAGDTSIKSDFYVKFLS